MSRISVERVVPRPPAIERIKVKCAFRPDDVMAIYHSADEDMIMFNSREGSRTCIIGVAREDIQALAEALKEMADQ
ncbi:MAG: hypothetical protein AB7U75_14745 [Hyphomicrobiaceae bacterium]